MAFLNYYSQIRTDELRVRFNTEMFINNYFFTASVFLNLSSMALGVAVARS